MAADAVGKVQRVQQADIFLHQSPVIGNLLQALHHFLLMLRVKVPELAVQILAVAVAQKQEAIPGHMADHRIPGVGSLCVDQPADHPAAQIQTHAPLKGQGRRNHPDLAPVRVFSLDHPAAEVNILPPGHPLSHGLIVPGPPGQLRQLPVGLAPGNVQSLPGVETEAVIPVPVGQGHKIRPGQTLPVQLLLQLGRVGRGIARVKEQRIARPPHIADVGPVGVVLVGTHIDMFTELLKHDGFSASRFSLFPIIANPGPFV